MPQVPHEDPRPLGVGIALAFGLGLAAQAAQALLLREVLGQVEGTEIVLGLALAGWLVFGAAGALLARRPAARSPSPTRLLVVSVVVAAVLSAVGIHGVRMVRGWLPLVPGEVPGVLLSMAAAAGAAALPAAAFGFAFPCAARVLGGPRAYGVEAAGALVGGLVFTFVLAPLLAPLATGALVVLLVAGLGASRSRALVAVAGIAVLCVFLGPALERASRQAAYASYLPGLTLLDTAQSRRGPIDVLGLPGQASLYRLGHLDVTSPDAEGGAAKAHFALALHPAPRRVFVVGGGPAVLREMLAGGVVGIASVDPDPEALEVFRPHLEARDRAALDDPRLHVLGGDARASLRAARAAYDVVAVFGMEPATAASNRFFTEEFYGQAAGALAEGGVLVQALPGAENFLGPGLMERNALVRAAARTAFAQVVVSPGEAGYLVASQGDEPTSLDPEVLARRFRARDVRSDAFTEHHFAMMLQPGEADRLAVALDAAAGRLRGERNTDERPRAFFRTFLLRAEETGSDLGGVLAPGVLAGLFVGLALCILALARFGRTGSASLATTGLASMGAFGVILLGYQVARGDLYGEIGALAGTFMAGLAVGTRVRVSLLVLDLLTVAALLALPLVPAAPAGAFAAAACVGILAGATFPSALRGGGDPARLYALDLAGSALGALLVVSLYVPSVGVPVTCAGLAALKALGALSRRRGSPGVTGGGGGSPSADAP